MIDVIIATYNASDFLKKCVAAVQQNTELPYRIVVSDDWSGEPDMMKLLSQLCQQVTVFKSKVRRGFAGNNTWAIEQTDAEFFCLLNQDTEPEPGWLAAMVETMLSDDKIGVVGAKLVYPESKEDWSGMLQHVGIARKKGGEPYHPYRGYREDWPAANVERDVNAVTGACMLIRRKCWDDIGGFDEEYSMGQFEDCDFCWRASKNNWRVVMQPKAVLYHYEHGCGMDHVVEGHDKNKELLLKRWKHLEADGHLFGGSE